MPAASTHKAVAAVTAISAALLALLALAGGASGGRESQRGTADGPRDRQAPTAPANLRVTAATPTSVSFAWNPSSDNVGVRGYYFYVGGSRSTISGTSFKAIGLRCGQSISVWVVAYDRAGNRSTPTGTIASTAACPDTQRPTAPAGFRQAATGQTAVVLAWDASTDNVGVVGYRVYRDGLPVVSSAEPSATLSGLLCESVYQYAVDAVDAAGNRSDRSSLWVQTAACADEEPPSPPTGLSVAERTTSSLTFAWSASTDNVAVTGYRVTVAGRPDLTVVLDSASGRVLAAVGEPEPRATLSNLACGTAYTVAVEAYDSTGNTSSQATTTGSTANCLVTDTLPPAKPVLSLGPKTHTSLVLQWQPGSDNVGVRRYNVFRGTTASATSLAKVGETTGLSYTFTGLSCSTSYSLGLQVEDAAGNTSLLAEAIWYPARTLECSSSPSEDTARPSQPGNLVVSAATATSVSLAWAAATDNVGVTGYGVYRNGTLVASPGQPGATVSGLTCGTAYPFEVDAADAAGNRSTRASVTASTSPCSDTQPPTAPGSPTATSRTATSIALTWSAASDNVGVAGYGLYQGGSLVGSATTTTGIFAGLTCNTNYTLAVDAYDAAGHRSAKATVMVATTACPDTTPPSVPTGLAASAVTQTSLNLTWNASTDVVGVTGYDVFRNGTKMATVTVPASPQTGLTCGTAYTFGVEALDAAGNRSARAQLSPSTTACSSPPPPTGGTGVAVSPSGNDTTCVRGDTSKPCASFNKAYSIAQCGDVVQLASGTYSSQTIREVAALSSCGQDVVFKPASGAVATVNGSVSLGDNNAIGSFDTNAPDHLTLQGFSYSGTINMWGDADGVTVDGVQGGSVLIQGASNITVRNSEFGPCPSYPENCTRFFILDGSNAGEPRTSNILVENNTIHDFEITRSGDHWECVFATGGQNVTFRGNRVYNCWTYDMVLGANSYSGGFSNWVIENNWFGRTCCYGSADRLSAINLYDVKDALIRFNSFAPGQTVTNENPGSGRVSNVRVVGNILGASGCADGASYSYNAFLSGTGCGTNKTTIGTPYVNASSLADMDYHLVPGTPVEGFVTLNTGDFALSFDKDGHARGVPRDAGADER